MTKASGPGSRKIMFAAVDKGQEQDGPRNDLSTSRGDR